MLKTISVLFLFFSGISAHKFPLITGFFCAYFSLGARFSCTCDLRKEWTALGTSAGATMMKNEEMLWEFRTFWAFFFQMENRLQHNNLYFVWRTSPALPGHFPKPADHLWLLWNSLFKVWVLPVSVPSVSEIIPAQQEACFFVVVLLAKVSHLA